MFIHHLVDCYVFKRKLFVLSLFRLNTSVTPYNIYMTEQTTFIDIKQSIALTFQTKNKFLKHCMYRASYIQTLRYIEIKC